MVRFYSAFLIMEDRLIGTRYDEGILVGVWDRSVCIGWKYQGGMGWDSI